MSGAAKHPSAIRVGSIADAEGITKLINAAFNRAERYIVGRDRIGLEKVRDLFKSGVFLIAEEAGAVAGCVYLELHSERSYLGLLSVDPLRQRAGLGSILMTAAEEYCRNTGSRVMDLKIINLRADNHAFYTHRGYVDTGTEPFPPELNPKVACHFVKMSKPLT